LSHLPDGTLISIPLKIGFLHLPFKVKWTKLIPLILATPKLSQKFNLPSKPET
jgi:hypothetical protein